MIRDFLKANTENGIFALLYVFTVVIKLPALVSTLTFHSSRTSLTETLLH